MYGHLILVHVNLKGMLLLQQSQRNLCFPAFSSTFDNNLVFSVVKLSRFTYQFRPGNAKKRRDNAVCSAALFET